MQESMAWAVGPSVSLHPIQPATPLGFHNNALANAKIIDASRFPPKSGQPPIQGRIEYEQRRELPELSAGHNQPVSARDYEGNFDLASAVDVPADDLEWRIGQLEWCIMIVQPRLSLAAQPAAAFAPGGALSGQ